MAGGHASCLHRDGAGKGNPRHGISNRTGHRRRHEPLRRFLFAVEVLPGVTPCTAEPFLDDAIDKPRIKSNNNGIQWSVLDGADQGAGNSYEETVQAAIGSQPCIATRAFVHSTNIGNYDPGTVKPFNRAKLNAIIDRMRHSFRFLPH